jgi:hypothetical protein
MEYNQLLFKHKNTIQINMSEKDKIKEQQLDHEQHKENNEPIIDYDTVKMWLEERVHQTITSKHKDFDMMNKILQKHPNFNEWKNKNCEAFKITRSAKNKALQVHIKMTNSFNTQEEKPKINTLKTLKKKEQNEWRIVSWVACAKGKTGQSSSDKNQLTQAMRFSIRKQIKNFRDTNCYNPKCALCEKTNQLEVDHYPLTFATMRDDFLSNVNDVDKIKIRWDKNKISYRFGKGEDINTKWQRYHSKRATYRWLCSDCNKRMNKKK